MTRTQLANRALVIAKLDTVESIEDGDDEAAVCRELILPTVYEVLGGSHDWSFAKKRANLHTIPGAEFNNWDYVYDLPDDMVIERAFVRPEDDHRYAQLDQTEFEIFAQADDGSADGAFGRLGCNESSLDCVYTKKFASDQISLLPDPFSIAVAYLLASYLCEQFGGVERQQMAFAQYLNYAYPRAVSFDTARTRRTTRGGYELANETVVRHGQPPIPFRGRIVE